MNKYDQYKAAAAVYDNMSPPEDDIEAFQEACERLADSMSKEDKANILMVLTEANDVLISLSDKGAFTKIDNLELQRLLHVSSFTRYIATHTGNVISHREMTEILMVLAEAANGLEALLHTRVCEPFKFELYDLLHICLLVKRKVNPEL